MGINYYLVKNEKELFDLGKGSWSAIFPNFPNLQKFNIKSQFRDVEEITNAVHLMLDGLAIDKCAFIAQRIFDWCNSDVFLIAEYLDEYSKYNGLPITGSRFTKDNISSISVCADKGKYGAVGGYDSNNQPELNNSSIERKRKVIQQLLQRPYTKFAYNHYEADSKICYACGVKLSLVAYVDDDHRYCSSSCRDKKHVELNPDHLYTDNETLGLCRVDVEIIFKPLVDAEYLEENFENDVFKVSRYTDNCDCDYYINNSVEHKDTCPTIFPNFIHKKSGFSIKWYKYPFRSPSSNTRISKEELSSIVKECVESVKNA